MAMAKKTSNSDTLITVIFCVGLVVFILIVAVVIAAMKGKIRLRKVAETTEIALSRTVNAPVGPDPMIEAYNKVKEDRGEPAGKNAVPEIPEELKLYKDPHRFLAIQVASWREQNYPIPKDFSALATLIKGGSVSQVPKLGPGYVLFGVGGVVGNELTYFDEQEKKSVPLFRDDQAIQFEFNRIDGLIADLKTQSADLGKQLAAAAKNDKAIRADLATRIAELKKQLTDLGERQELLKAYYSQAKTRQTLFAEFANLESLAKDFNGHTYDLSDLESRKAFEVQLLCSLRPPAFEMMKQIGQAYEQRYNRPIPVSSMYRTVEYQRDLGEAGNPNAVRINVPPHTTGLAFDIFNGYMTSDEQKFLMSMIADLERAGKVEAIRENRDHYHIFVFPNGRPPSESVVKESEGKGGKSSSSSDESDEKTTKTQAKKGKK